MKKLLLFSVVLLLSLGQLFAGPVDVKTAKSIGEKFVRTNMNSLRNFQSSKHISTVSDDKGNACLYIFNIDDKGFYIVSADDRSKPVLAYSDEGALDANNLPTAMSYYLERYASAISYAIENDLEAEQEIVDEWNLVRSRGIVSEKTLGRSVPALIDLLWNQDNPYNYYCPTAPGGPGGRAYVGCAADAMAMVMKFWNYPDAGVGEHSYKPDGFPQQTVTLGEAYDWDNMPKQLYYNSPQNQVHAVASLMYHCGVTINMQYGADGSGAYSSDVPEAMSSHFKYTNKMKLEYRDYFGKVEWEDMLIKNFDQGFPAFYAGHSQGSGGHAFVCDGYTDNRYFHFNWGWTGSGNGNFAIDALTPMGWNFNDGQNAIFDMIPDYAYQSMAAAPAIETKANSAYSKKGVIRVNVPTVSESGDEITSIDKVVILRDGVEVYSTTDATPGSVVEFEDEVGQYDCYYYTSYIVSNGIIGRWNTVPLSYGPSCEWKLIVTTTSFQGWNGAYLQFVNSEGTVYNQITTTNSTPVNEFVQITEGNFSIKWTAPTSPINSLTIKLKNSSNETVYEFSGSSNSLTVGTIYSGENSCENCQAPENLKAEEAFQGGNVGVLVSWDKVGAPQSYKVYRSADNENYTEVGTVESTSGQYFDVAEPGEYYYQVTAYNSYCESLPATTADGEYDYVKIDVTSIKENAIDAVVFPNPTTGNLNINAEDMTNVSVYNMVGQKVVDLDVDTDQYVLDMSSMEVGVYMLKVVSRNGEMTQRVVLM